MSNLEKVEIHINLIREISDLKRLIASIERKEALLIMTEFKM